jgi:predicted TIM-barrel fold metal-dependent hydrolase
MPPLTTMDKVREELAWSKDHGACGVFLNALECDRLLTDPYFHPLYTAAEELDLALCVHAGNNSPTAHDFFIDSSFMLFKLAVINSFHGLIMENVPAMFPKARWGFIEVSAQWIPYVLNDLELRFRKRGKRLPKNALKEFNMYVACQVTDDLPAILAVAGEDNLVVGTDYGHSDTSTEIEALRMMRGKEGISPGIIDKILGANAKALYGM